MFWLALRAGSRASQLLELLWSRAGERAAGQRGVPGERGGVGSVQPRGRGNGGRQRWSRRGGTPIELPMTSSKSGKNSAWKCTVEAARQPYSCRPFSLPSEPPAPRREACLQPRTPVTSTPHPRGPTPHLMGPSCTPLAPATSHPGSAPSAARRAQWPQEVSGPWTGAGPPSGRGSAGSPRVPWPCPAAPRGGFLPRRDRSWSLSPFSIGYRAEIKPRRGR